MKSCGYCGQPNGMHSCNCPMDRIAELERELAEAKAEIVRLVGLLDEGKQMWETEGKRRECFEWATIERQDALTADNARLRNELSSAKAELADRTVFLQADEDGREIARLRKALEDIDSQEQDFTSPEIFYWNAKNACRAALASAEKGEA